MLTTMLGLSFLSVVLTLATVALIIDYTIPPSWYCCGLKDYLEKYGLLESKKCYEKMEKRMDSQLCLFWPEFIRRLFLCVNQRSTTGP